MNKDARDALAAVAASPEGVHTLATVVAIAGSSYRRPGARMLVHAAGFTAGSVSGGCLEREIARRGRWWAQAGPALRRFSKAAADREDDDTDGAREDDGDGGGHVVVAAASGCDGTVDVLVENVTADDAAGPLAALRWVAARRAPACIATVVRGAGALPAGTRCAATADGGVWPAMGDDGDGDGDGDGGRATGKEAAGARLLAACAADARSVLASGAPAWRRYGDDDGAIAPVDVFLEYVPPPRELLVAGRHHDVAPLVRVARMMGWEVTSAAAGVPPRALGDPDRVIAPDEAAVAGWARARPGAAIVLMTHDLALDGRLLGAVLGPSAAGAAPPPSYLGVLGPRRRTAELVRGLAAPARAAAAALVRTPVGLDLGGDGPEAIALSIASDLHATWHGRAGGRLCPPGDDAAAFRDRRDRRDRPQQPLPQPRLASAS